MERLHSRLTASQENLRRAQEDFRRSQEDLAREREVSARMMQSYEEELAFYRRGEGGASGGSGSGWGK